MKRLFPAFFQALTLVLLFGSSIVVKAVDVDTDGDGVTDADEVAAGTNPFNSQSVQWKSLGSWRFTAGTLTGDDGQQPIAQNNVSIVSNGFDGPGVQIPSGGSPSLKYRATETSGKPNISPVRGTIYFRIKPSWATGAGPGSWVTVLQTANMAVRFSPDGSILMLTSTSGGVTTTNVQISVDIGSFGAFWSYGLVTYSPEETSLSFDAPSTRVAGPGIAPPTNLNDPNNFLAIGSAADGTGAVNALVDEVVVFNAPGVIGVTPTLISAISSNAPPGLNLIWISATNAITEVKRRLIGTTAWGVARAGVGTNFFDSTVVEGERYEYNVNTRVAAVSTGLPDEVGQFLKGARNGKPLHSLGRVILLVDKTLTNAIESELSGFITNLIGDGWKVMRLDVPRHIENMQDTAFLTNYFNMTNVIRPFVQSSYAQYGSEIKYILVIGHVTVSYTGTLADDGHAFPGFGRGAHTGAWSCDLFYGDVDGIWTDTLSTINSDFSFNRNYPNDGRLDQNKIPANAGGVAKIEIPVARIDLSFLPSFADSEIELTKKYFKKNGDFRKGIRTFAADGMAAEYLNPPVGFPKSTMAPELGNELLSKVSVLKQPTEGDFLVDTRSLLFGIQSGPSFFDRINDAYPVYEHTTAHVAAGLTTTNCAFYVLRGSYFPDWNTQDNFLRAPLATPNGGLLSGSFLGSSKGWRMTGLGVGLSAGSEMADIIDTWLVPGDVQSVRTIELMGDATLRYPVLAPSSTLSWKVTNNTVALTWFASAGAAGYYVYRSTNGIYGNFENINTTVVTGTNYTDGSVPSGNIIYMIRSAAVVNTGSARYTNLSQGIFSRPITSADPAVCCIGDQTILEDGSMTAVAFSIGEAGSESGLVISAASSNTSLLPNASISLGGAGAERSVAATPLVNRSGSATVTITAQTVSSTVVKQFTLTVSSVNDSPGFTKGADVVLAQGAGSQVIVGWATAITPGPNESGQQVTFVVTNDSPYLFVADPAVSGNGVLTLTPVSGVRGQALVTVQAQDNGGTANGGSNISYPQTFNITVGFSQDTDADGLPDDFEQFYGFDPVTAGDGPGDWDGDGMTNLEELTAGTNPKDSRSSLRISSAASQSPTFAVQFNSVAGRTYALEANDAFPAADQWQTLFSSIAGSGTPIQELDTDAGNSSRRIYRVTTPVSGGQELVTEYAGLYRQTLLANSDTLLSIPFMRPASELGAVVSVNVNSVQVRGPASWQANQWVYAGASQSNTYFMLIRSGALEGNLYTITANTANTLTLDLQGDSLSGLQAGDALSIAPYWTLGTIFKGGAGIHATTDTFSRQTEVLFPNLSGTGINLSAAATYYFFQGAWRQVGQAGVVKNNEVVAPDMYVIVRHNNPSSTTVTTEGAVLAGNLQCFIRRNSGLRQDNFFALPRPLNIALDDAGLVNLSNPDTGAFRASPDPFSRIDELLVFDNALPGRNKPAAATYYFRNGGWRKVGQGNADRGGDLVFQPGTGIIIRAGTNTSGVVWTNTPPY